MTKFGFEPPCKSSGMNLLKTIFKKNKFVKKIIVLKLFYTNLLAQKPPLIEAIQPN